MPIREFHDAGGTCWQVWATTPMRGNVRPQFAFGWLAFESGAERRRLTPIPSDWAEADDEALCVLLARAAPPTRDPGAPPPPVEAVRDDLPSTTAAAGLEVTVARVRAVIREVEASWQHEAAG
jgi:hypothetical protein